METFLRRTRRRLRVVWAWATSAWVAPAVSATAGLVIAIGWLGPWGWPEPLAGAFVAATAALILVAATLQRLPSMAVARAADRGLITDDTFSAALQFESLDTQFGERIRQRANDLAATAEVAEAAPLRGYGRRWALAGALAVAAIALGLAPNPQDEVRAERARDAALLDAVADDLEEQADTLAEQRPDDAVADQLRSLAQELRQTEDLDEARQSLEEAQQALDAARPDNFASQRAAAEGLERSVSDRPLAAQGGSAAEQLAALASTLDGLSADELAAAAQRLQDLGETQALGNPEAAAALTAAAEALEAGDLAAARAVLGEAALAQGAALDAVSAQLAADQAAATLAQGAATVAAGSGTGQGTGQGQGQGQGSGEGQGAGQGQGQGAGQGSGQGGSGAQGQVGGAGGGSGSGRGGVGTPGGTDQPRIDTNDDQRATVIDPDAAGPGDEAPLGGTPTGAAGEVVGRGDGLTTAGLAQVSLADVIADYADRATASAERRSLPPNQRELVGDYFDFLSQ